MSNDERVRLDKWLWAARFYKTRALAQEAVDGGKVRVEGQRTKSSREVRVGMRLELVTGFDSREVRVLALATRRGGAADAAGLYEESAASVARREESAARRRAAALSTPAPDHRPDKQERKQLRRLREQDV